MPTIIVNSHVESEIAAAVDLAKKMLCGNTPVRFLVTCEGTYAGKIKEAYDQLTSIGCASFTPGDAHEPCKSAFAKQKETFSNVFVIIEPAR